MSGIQASTESSFHPRGIFLTWQKDPTTTMTVQWLKEGELLPLVAGHADGQGSMDIGFLDHVSQSEEALWKQGYAIEFLAEADRRRYLEEIFAGKGRIAWSDEGLLFSVDVSQKDHRESENIQRLWVASSVELMVADVVDKERLIHVTIAPGLDENQNGPRVYALSNNSGLDLNAEAISLKVLRTDTGYRLSASIPWKYLPWVTPKLGSDLRVQISMNNRGDNIARRLVWYPSNRSGADTKFTYLVRLAEKSGVPSRISASAKFSVDRGVCSVYGLPELAGANIELKAGDQTLGHGVLVAEESTPVSHAEIELISPPTGKRWGTLTVYVDGVAALDINPERTPSDYQLPEDVVLEYWQEGKKDTRQSVSISPRILDVWPGMFMYRTELTNLNPDTLYRFCPRGQTGGLMFRTMPDTLHRPLRVAMGGDTLHRKQWLEETNRVAMTHNPDFIVWGGDLGDTNGEKDSLYRWEYWFDAIRDTLVTEEGRVIPIIVAIGNHDVQKGYCHNHEGYEPVDAWRSRIAPEFFSFFAFPGQPGYGVLDFGDYLSIIILDTAHSNPIAGRQTEWLESVLEARKNVPHVLPVYHIPAYPGVKDYNGKYETQVRENWIPLFDRYAIRTAFEHHNHAYKRTKPLYADQVKEGGTVYLGDGAWGVSARPTLPVDSTWYLQTGAPVRHAILLTLDKDRQHYLVKDSEGAVIDEYVSER